MAPSTGYGKRRSEGYHTRREQKKMENSREWRERKLKRESMPRAANIQIGSTSLCPLCHGFPHYRQDECPKFKSSVEPQKSSSSSSAAATTAAASSTKDSTDTDNPPCKCNQRICKGVFETCNKCGGKNHCPNSCTKMSKEVTRSNKEDLYLYGKANEVVVLKNSSSGSHDGGASKWKAIGQSGQDSKGKAIDHSSGPDSKIGASEKKQDGVQHKMAKPEIQVTARTGKTLRKSERTSNSGNLVAVTVSGKSEGTPSKSTDKPAPVGSNLINLTGESKLSAPMLGVKKNIVMKLSSKSQSTKALHASSNASPQTSVKSAQTSTRQAQKKSDSIPSRGASHSELKSTNIPLKTTSCESRISQSSKPSQNLDLTTKTKQLERQMAKVKPLPRLMNVVPGKKKDVWIIGDKVAHQAVVHENKTTGKDTLGLEIFNASVPWQVDNTIRLQNFKEWLDKTMIMACRKPDFLVVHLGYADFLNSNIEKMDTLITEMCTTIEEMIPDATPVWSDILLKPARPNHTPTNLTAENNRIVRVNSKARTKFVLNGGKAIHHIQFTAQALELYDLQNKKMELSEHGLDVFLDDLKEALKYFFKREAATDYWGKDLNEDDDDDEPTSPTSTQHQAISKPHHSSSDTAKKTSAPEKTADKPTTSSRQRNTEQRLRLLKHIKKTSTVVKTVEEQKQQPQKALDKPSLSSTGTERHKNTSIADKLTARNRHINAEKLTATETPKKTSTPDKLNSKKDATKTPKNTSASDKATTITNKQHAVTEKPKNTSTVTKAVETPKQQLGTSEIPKKHVASEKTQVVSTDVASKPKTKEPSASTTVVSAVTRPEKTASNVRKSQIAEHGRQTWIIGDDVVKGAGEGNMQLPDVKHVSWFGMEGGRIADVTGMLTKQLSIHPAPHTVIIHVGGNDIFKSTRESMHHGIERLLQETRKILPKARIMWSNILPRLLWYGESRQGSGASLMKSLNKHACNVCRKLKGDNGIIEYFESRFLQEKVNFTVDGAHLSARGFEQYRREMNQAIMTKNSHINKAYDERTDPESPGNTHQEAAREHTKKHTSKEISIIDITDGDEVSHATKKSSTELKISDKTKQHSSVKTSNETSNERKESKSACGRGDDDKETSPELEIGKSQTTTQGSMSHCLRCGSGHHTIIDCSIDSSLPVLSSIEMRAANMPDMKLLVKCLERYTEYPKPTKRLTFKDFETPEMMKIVSSPEPILKTEDSWAKHQSRVLQNLVSPYYLYEKIFEPLYCLICDMKFKFQKEYDIHARSAEHARNFISSNEKSELIQRVVSLPSIFSSGSPSKAEQSKNPRSATLRLKMTADIHKRGTDLQFYCRVCDGACKGPLQSHIDSPRHQYKEAKLIRCRECNIYFSTPGYLTNHVNTLLHKLVTLRHIKMKLKINERNVKTTNQTSIQPKKASNVSATLNSQTAKWVVPLLQVDQ
ncbi:uncharacterized protein [Amphiura filiformis]|uniref:uncharacterized protein n=1 Tax=Amphiura filiformis TaxID=82378 RepID=UPI003B21790D